MPRPALPGVNGQGRRPGRLLALGLWSVVTLDYSVVMFIVFVLLEKIEWSALGSVKLSSCFVC